MKQSLTWLILTLSIMPTLSLAAQMQRFQQAPLEQALQQIQPATSAKRSHLRAKPSAEPQFNVRKKTYSRNTQKIHIQLQQEHHGIAVLGGRITVHHRGQATEQNQAISSIRTYPVDSKVDGQVITGIDISAAQIEIYNDLVTRQAALTNAISRFEASKKHNDIAEIEPVDTTLVISMQNNDAALLYHVRFYVKTKNQHQPRLINQFIDAANTDVVYKTWNDIQHKHHNHPDKGLGGNTKTTSYEYGVNDYPALIVTKKGNRCTLENTNVKVVNALEKPNSDGYHKAYRYRCAAQEKDQHTYCTTNPWWTELFNDSDDPVNDGRFDQYDWDNGDWDWEDDDEPLRRLNRMMRSEKRQQSLTTPKIKNFMKEALDNEYCYTAYSPANDAHFFGQTVHNMYQQWFDTDVLSTQLVLRVHVGTKIQHGKVTETFANAYWDPWRKTMNFGDGHEDRMYPLVTLDVAAHEIGHGFTNEHANLSYFEQSGSLNEAFSDMAGAATMAFLQETEPKLYQHIYHRTDMNWSIGPTINIMPFDIIVPELQTYLETTTDSDLQNMADLMDFIDYSTPLRYMHQPSKDEVSADCFRQVDGCAISYEKMREQAFEYGQMAASLHCTPAEYEMCIDSFAQSAIVHEGSGIFNKAFYLLATTDGWSVRKAFELMLTANRDGYWIDPGVEQQNFFNNAACATLSAANDLQYPVADVTRAFNRVGLLLADDPDLAGSDFCPLANI